MKERVMVKAGIAAKAALVPSKNHRQALLPRDFSVLHGLRDLIEHNREIVIARPFWFT